MSLSTEENKQLLSLLKKLPPGFLPKEIFQAIARITVTSTFVTVPFVRIGGDIKVYLERRGSDDSGYPNMLHPAGKIILATDKNLNETYERLLQSEFKGIKIKKGPVFVDTVFEDISRGKELTLLHYIEFKSGFDESNLYNPQNLPEDVILTDIHRIEKAFNHYVKKESSTQKR